MVQNNFTQTTLDVYFINTSHMIYTNTEEMVLHPMLQIIPRQRPAYREIGKKEFVTEEVFIKVLPIIPNTENKVCRLGKSLHSLKQASRLLFAKLTQALIQQGFDQAKNGYSLFIHSSSYGLIRMLLIFKMFLFVYLMHLECEPQPRA